MLLIGGFKWSSLWSVSAGLHYIKIQILMWPWHKDNYREEAPFKISPQLAAVSA